MTAIVRQGLVALSLLLVTTPVWAQATPAADLRGFGIVLVLGDVQDGATSDNIPAAARAALADLKDFLPYRSYRVLDTAWLLASSTAASESEQPAAGTRRTGPTRSSSIAHRSEPSSLQIAFEMREPEGMPNGERQSRIVMRRCREEIQQIRSPLATALENQLRQSGGCADPRRRRTLFVRS